MAITTRINQFLLIFLIVSSCPISCMDWYLIAQNNQTYNQNNSFIQLPKETIPLILSYITPLENSAEATAKLHYSCKYFNKLPFKLLISQYQKHNKEEKNNALRNFLSTMNDPNYWDKRYAASLLIGAGADTNTTYYSDSLLLKAVDEKDKHIIQFLFNSGANPHQKDFEDPIIFRIKNIEIAKIFDMYQCDWNQTTKGITPNILHANLLHNPSSELIQFYLERGANPKICDRFNQECLLHELVSHPIWYSIKNVDDYVKIGELLIKAAPKLVNALNRNGQTPIQKAQAKNKELKQDNPLYQANIRLMELFKKTAEKLKQKNHNEQI